MRAECVGTVELTVATNGVDFTGGTPPLLFAFSREVSLHVWGCAPPTVDVSNASQYYAPPGGAPCVDHQRFHEIARVGGGKDIAQP